jgi:hypothetical protein
MEACMKLIGAAFSVAVLCAVGVGAQTQTTKTESKQKIEIKEGKEIKASGCLERNPAGGYSLTSRETGGMRYTLVTDDDLSKHLGHRVEVHGKATDKGDAKVKIESKVGTSGSGDESKEKTKTTTTLEGDLGMRYLGVKSVKMISTSCM